LPIDGIHLVVCSQTTELMKGNDAFLETIAKTLTRRCETLAVAESVTSGNLQAAFSSAKKATEFFQGGITAYNTGQKARHLHVDPIEAERTNCVSEKISRAMALEVCIMFSSNWGIAITGYAAPVPALNVRNTLFAWYAIALNGRILVSKKIETKKIAMDKAQQHYTHILLKDLSAIATGLEQP
jgi:PncC family amidohydrolase